MVVKSKKKKKHFILFGILSFIFIFLFGNIFSNINYGDLRFLNPISDGPSGMIVNAQVGDDNRPQNPNPNSSSQIPSAISSASEDDPSDGYKFESGYLYQLVFNAFGVNVSSYGSESSEKVKLKKIDPDKFLTKVEIRPMDFIDYPNSVSFDKQKSCIVGGNYSVKIYAEPENGDTFNLPIKTLFHCKTTKELLDMAKFPGGWIHHDLIVYCNDGNSINVKDTNFDFLTSKLDTYKACILRDQNSQKTIIYGLEVGNPIVDNDPKFFFNFGKMKGGIIDSKFKFVSISGGGNVKSNLSLFAILNLTNILNKYSNQLKDKDGNNYSEVKDLETAVTEFVGNPSLNGDNPSYTKMEDAFNKFDIKFLDKQRTNITLIRDIRDLRINISETLKSYKIQFSYDDKNGNGGSYYFNYDYKNKFYILRDTTEDLGINLVLNEGESRSEMPLLDTIPDIGLSRMVLIRVLADYRIYGFEKNYKEQFPNAQNFITNTDLQGNTQEITVPDLNLKPVYILQSTSGMNSKSCQRWVDKYQSDVLNHAEVDPSQASVKCEDTVLYINSYAIDYNNYGKFTTQESLGLQNQQDGQNTQGVGNNKDGNAQNNLNQQSITQQNLNSNQQVQQGLSLNRRGKVDSFNLFKNLILNAFLTEENMSETKE